MSVWILASGAGDSVGTSLAQIAADAYAAAQSVAKRETGSWVPKTSDVHEWANAAVEKDAAA